MKAKAEHYLSGLADRETEIQIENAMLEDDNLLEQFIEASEKSICAAPPGLTESVMRGINQPIKIVTIAPALSKKLCAAACFCSAAAIMVFTMSGLDRQLSDFILNYSGKLNDLLSTIKIF